MTELENCVTFLHGLASDCDERFDIAVRCAAKLHESEHLFLLFYTQFYQALDTLLVEHLIRPLHQGLAQLLMSFERFFEAVESLVEDLIVELF